MITHWIRKNGLPKLLTSQTYISCSRPYNRKGRKWEQKKNISCEARNV